MAARRPDGLPGYVQGVGKSPGVVRANGTQLYATGAFVMAACELSKLAPILCAGCAPAYRSAPGGLGQFEEMNRREHSAAEPQPNGDFNAETQRRRERKGKEKI